MFEEKEKLICPDCKSLGLQSYSYVQKVISSAVEIYADPQGNFHNHKTGNTIYHMNCDKGHFYSHTRPNKGCNISGCSWNLSQLTNGE